MKQNDNSDSEICTFTDVHHLHFYCSYITTRALKKPFPLYSMLSVLAFKAFDAHHLMVGDTD